METEIYEMIHKVHEALEGRYDLDGYDLTTIYYFLCEYSNSSTKNDESVIAHVSGSLPTVDKPDWCTEDKHVPGCSCGNNR